MNYFLHNKIIFGRYGVDYMQHIYFKGRVASLILIYDPLWSKCGSAIQLCTDYSCSDCRVALVKTEWVNNSSVCHL
jgi:hypothetical protein